jgi:hypothetical protein
VEIPEFREVSWNCTDVTGEEPGSLAIVDAFVVYFNSDSGEVKL